MLTHYTKSALICAILPIGLFVAGCAGEGSPGYYQFKAGDYAQAKTSFTTDIQNRPNSALAQFNMGDSYLQEGDHARANGMFRQAAASGKDRVPDYTLELGGRNQEDVSVRTMACRHLHEDGQLDVNCNDRIVAEARPAPAPAPAPAVVYQAAPIPVAVEAQATPVLERKQDRN